MKYIKLITFLYLLTSCTAFLEKTKKPWLINLKPPPGPPAFQAAVADGCNTAIQENRWSIYATTQSEYYINPDYFETSPLYRRVYRNAYIFCNLAQGYLTTYGQNPSSFWVPDFKLRIKALPFTEKSTTLHDAPPGPKNFRKGWRDGCNSGKAATGQSHQRFGFYFFMDARFIEGEKFNAVYYRGWDAAFWYCERFYDHLADGTKGSLY